jgi:hypothetical protein
MEWFRKSRQKFLADFISIIMNVKSEKLNGDFYDPNEMM